MMIKIQLLLVIAFTVVCSRAGAVTQAQEEGRDANNDEFALIVLANKERAALGIPALIWSDKLAKAARSHNYDMATNNCYLHTDCVGGRSSFDRIASFFGYLTGAGEIINADKSLPMDNYYNQRYGWMQSQGHRDRILDARFNQFGGANIRVERLDNAHWSYATGDFAQAGIDPALVRNIPGGAVIDGSVLMNYFDDQGRAPDSVRAVIGNQCLSPSLSVGTQANGTYQINFPTGLRGCVPVRFEAVRSDGVIARFPYDGRSFLVSVDGSQCAPQVVAPPVDCGASTQPDPITDPVPGPTPGTDPGSVTETAASFVLEKTKDGKEAVSYKLVVTLTGGELQGGQIRILKNATVWKKGPPNKGNFVRTFAFNRKHQAGTYTLSIEGTTKSGLPIKINSVPVTISVQ